LEASVLSKLLEFVREDVERGDVTCDALGVGDEEVGARVVARERCVVAGVSEALLLLRHFGLECRALRGDGEPVGEGDVVLEVRGSARKILELERTLLNLISHMSGVATATREIVERARAANPRVFVAATRKTLPGLRFFEKRAVRLGGGDPHRHDLSDMVLIKSNHVRLLGLGRALELARARTSFSKKIEVEVSTVEDAVVAARMGADIVMLDNVSPRTVREAAEALEREGLRGRVLLEASGGVTVENVAEYAGAGADIVSLGSITDSARAIDFRLVVEQL